MQTTLLQRLESHSWEVGHWVYPLGGKIPICRVRRPRILGREDPAPTDLQPLWGSENLTHSLNLSPILYYKYVTRQVTA